MGNESARRARRTQTPAVEEHVAVAALRDGKTIAELAKHFRLHQAQSVKWKRQILDDAAGGTRGVARTRSGRSIWGRCTPKSASWHWRAILLAGALFKADLLSAKRGSRNHDLTIRRQAELRGIERGSVYYLSRPRQRGRSAYASH